MELFKAELMKSNYGNGHIRGIKDAYVIHNVYESEAR
jgi:hypothetical protein